MAASLAQRPEPAALKAARAYLASAVSELSTRVFPNGARLVIKRQPGRSLAVARISLSGGGEKETLALYLAASCRAGQDGTTTGASLSMDLETGEDAAIRLGVPAEDLPGLLSLVGANFLSPEFRQRELDAAAARLREAKRLSAADPALNAARLLRLAMDEAVPPPASLPGAYDPKTVWKEAFSPGRLRIVVVGDVDPQVLDAACARGFGSLPRNGAAAPGPEAFRPIRAARALPASAGLVSLRAELQDPGPGSSGFAALAVALTMLDDLVAPGTRTELPGPGSSRPAIVVGASATPRAAMADVATAAALLASGRCGEAGYGGTGTAPIAARLESYKAKALSRMFATSASSEALAYRIARSLDAGDDAAAFFRGAERIAALIPEDIVRSAREGLAEGAMAWIALGDPGLIASLEQSGFAAMR